MITGIGIGIETDILRVKMAIINATGVEKNGDNVTYQGKCSVRVGNDFVMTSFKEDEWKDILFDGIHYVRRHIVGGANRTLISVKTPSRSCRIGT